MNKQLEVLRLADALDSNNELILRIDAERASVELKKLYALNEVLLEKCHVLEKMVALLPPQRTWVGLTDEEIYEATKDVDTKPLRVIVNLLEAKLKEKNT